ncbi:MAG: acetylglutamate kinase [Candidatus Omnitrophota bacterium]
MEQIIKKANILIEALPYIRAFHKKITVIKYGGSILGEDDTRRGVLEDIVFLNYMGLRPVLVHGGGPHISRRIKDAGGNTDFVDGVRVTDGQTLKIVKEELSALNKQIVWEIKEFGGSAKGVIGENSRLITADKKPGNVDLGFVGRVIDIEKEAILRELYQDTIIVVPPLGYGKQGALYNINADEVAAHLAGALDAEKLVLLTDVRGVKPKPGEDNGFIPTLDANTADRLIREEVIQGGMIPKVRSCVTALNEGVRKAHIIDAHIPHALLFEIFTNEGIGTEIVR